MTLPGNDNNLSRQRPLLNALLVFLGIVFTTLGVFGIFLPVLPTTPFLLLAAACFARGSGRCYRWLMNNRWCGQYIRDYRDGKGVSKRHKLASLTLLWVTIGLSIAYAVDALWVRIALAVIALAVSTHILLLKTRQKE